MLLLLDAFASFASGFLLLGVVGYANAPLREARVDALLHSPAEMPGITEGLEKVVEAVERDPIVEAPTEPELAVPTPDRAPAATNDLDPESYLDDYLAEKGLDRKLDSYLDHDEVGVTTRRTLAAMDCLFDHPSCRYYYEQRLKQLRADPEQGLADLAYVIERLPGDEVNLERVQLLHFGTKWAGHSETMSDLLINDFTRETPPGDGVSRGEDGPTAGALRLKCFELFLQSTLDSDKLMEGMRAATRAHGESNPALLNRFRRAFVGRYPDLYQALEAQEGGR